jgi:hypothetical protein
MYFHRIRFPGAQFIGTPGVIIAGSASVFIILLVPKMDDPALPKIDPNTPL